MAASARGSRVAGGPAAGRGRREGPGAPEPQQSVPGSAGDQWCAAMQTSHCSVVRLAITLQTAQSLFPHHCLRQRPYQLRRRWCHAGKWELIYTTSGSILGTSRPPFLRPIGPIFQFIGAHAAARDDVPTAAAAETLCLSAAVRSSLCWQSCTTDKMVCRHRCREPEGSEQGVFPLFQPGMLVQFLAYCTPWHACARCRRLVSRVPCHLHATGCGHRQCSSASAVFKL